MDMEQHTPSLATCKNLKESGFSQEAFFCWSFLFGDDEYVVEPRSLIVGKEEFEFVCAAPILDEILEQLPREIPAGMLRYQQPMAMAYLSDGFSIGYSDMTGKYSRFTKNKNPAEAAALLWLELNGGNNE